MENKNIPLYKAEFNPDAETDSEFGLTAIGIVDEPAIMENFITLSKQQQFKIQNEDKRLLMAPAMISGMRIYRNSPENGEYYVYFDADVIRKLSNKFFKDGLISKFNLNHSAKDFVNDVYIVESWFTTDNSKEKEYGFNLPIGSWMITVKVDNDEVWQDYVKTGKVKGFSIEAFLQYVQIFRENKSVTISESDFMNKILSLCRKLD